MKIKGVVFDVDGVLIQSEPLLRKWREEFFSENGMIITEAEQDKLVGSNPRDMFRMLFPENEAEQQFWQEKYAVFKQQFTIDFTQIVDQRAYELLPQLREKGLELAIASSGPLESIEQMLAETKLEKYFSCVVSGEMFAQSKPNPEIYHYAVRELGLLSSQCVAVEDSYYGMQAARRAGLFVLGLKNTAYEMDFCFADRVIESLLEVANYC